MLYDSPEAVTTPFIPPLPSPESYAPPVIPPPPSNHNPPGWAQQPSTPGQYPYYPVTPHNTTPFIPTIPPSVHSTPAMHPPGSYFPPPTGLPNAHGSPAGQGFSADYTGYPNGNPTPFVPPSQPPPGTPWAAPGTGFSAFQQPLPQGVPWGPQIGMGGYTPGVPYPMVAPYATPAVAAWGMPLYGQPGMPPGPHNGYPGHTPWMHPTQPPPAPPQPPDTARANFRWTSNADRIDPFAEGPHCTTFIRSLEYFLIILIDGPVLEPFLVRAVSATIRINPLLSTPTGDDYLRWNMLFSTSNCYRTTESRRSWIKGRDAPATFPRLTHVRIISRSFPWMISVKAKRQNIGVTCGEVIDTISAYLHGDAAKKEYEHAPSRRRREIWSAYQFNRSTDANAPGGHLGEQLKRLDWLGSHSRFGGIICNDEFVKEACGDILPCTFELQCIQNYPLSQEEAVEQRRRQARDHSRPRSVGSRSSGGHEIREDELDDE